MYSNKPMNWVLFGGNAETNKFNYEVGKVYVFDYLGETVSKINGTSSEESRLHLRTLTEFEVVSKCEFILRVNL